MHQADETTPAPTPRQRLPHPLLVMLLLVLAAALATQWMDAGRFERRDGRVVPGTFASIPKQASVADFLAAGPPPSGLADRAHAANLVSAAVAVPAGMVKASALIVMVLFAGGTFGVLQRSGLLEAGLRSLIAGSRGRTVVVAASLMTAVAVGSSTLGLMSEYLGVVVLVRAFLGSVGLSPLFSTASVVLAAKIGFLASVTNPLPLLIAQPLVGVGFTSGIGMRIAVLMVLLPLALAYLMRTEGRRCMPGTSPPEAAGRPFGGRRLAMLAVLAAGVAALASGAARWHWSYPQLAAFYGVFAAALAAAAGMAPRSACDAFVEGAQKMVMPAMLIGMAKAVEILLQESRVLDRVIFDLSALAAGAGPLPAALGIATAVALLGFLVPSISGKAALSLPVLAPVGQLAGVSPDTTVLAFLLGSGLTNLVSPTSGLLLAFLAAGGVGYAQWLRFVAPLLMLFAVAAAAFIALSVALSG